MRKHLLPLILANLCIVLSTLYSSAQLTTWHVRNSTGDYDEQAMANEPSCYMYPMQYDGLWRGYIECPNNGPQCYAGFAVKTTQNLGNVCYRSRVDGSPTLRGGYGWYGGTRKENVRVLRRNFQLSFINQPTSPVPIELYFTKAEIDAMIAAFNAEYETNKTYSDLVILKYNGANQDLDPANNSTNNTDYEKITPTINFYNTGGGQYAYAEFQVSSYSEFYLALVDPRARYFVNDNSQNGDMLTTAVGNNANAGTSSAPFATINYAIGLAQPDDIIKVDAGTYIENVNINKSLTLKGVKAGIDPLLSLDRGQETLVLPANNDITNGAVFAVGAYNVTIDGFLLNGDNPAISGGISRNGTDINAAFGVHNQGLVVDGLKLKNNIMRNFNRYGIFLQRINQPTITENNSVSNNHFDNIGNRGVGMFNNAFASVSNNHLTRVANGILFANGSIASSLSIAVEGNSVEATGISITLQSVSAPSITISGNTVYSASGVNNGGGISMGAIATTGSVQVNNNTINNRDGGVGLSGVTAGGIIIVNGNAVSNTLHEGINISDVTAPGGVMVNGGSVTNCAGVGLFLVGKNVNFSISNFNLTNADVGIDASSTGPLMGLSFSNVNINDGTTGIRFYGPDLFFPGNVFTGVSFSNQSKEYILQTASSFTGQTIDASTAVFDGVSPLNMTLAQLFATEDKLTHKLDFNGVGYFKLKPNKVYITPNSFAATMPVVFGVATTFPDINRAVGCASPNDSIYIAAGSYINQVTLDKGVTLIGQGQNSTYILPPATIVAPPGAFTEKGIIQTAPGIGNVHIRDLSVTGTSGITPIILQTGGSVINSKVQGGNQGIYFRTESMTKTATIENNQVNAEFIGINVQGSNLTASLSNNDITVLNTGFSSGVFFGLDFATLPHFTATGNAIKGFVHSGFFGGSSNAVISQNSIVGTGPSIWQTTGNAIAANCNWFGTRDAELIATKFSGSVNYAPWLSSGVDNSSDNGFQPLANVCGGRQNKFYVNDNNQTGDIFTTAVGNNSNNGFSSAPFASIDFAISKAQAGDTIYVDGGNYPMSDLTINKSITILGPNHTISPNNASDKTVYNAARNAEARVTGATFTMGADWIIINGMRFTSNNAILLNENFSHIKFDKNYFDVASNGNTVQLQGISASPIVASDFSVTDNRFERVDNQPGNAIFIGAVKSLWMDNNTFIESGLSVNRSSAIRTSTTLSVEGFVFTNNYLKKFNQSIAPAILQGSVISANQFDSCSLGIIYVPGNIASNNVLISSNVFYNSRQARSILVRGGSGGGINNLNVSNNTFNQLVNGTNGIVSVVQLEYASANNFGITNVVGNKINISGDYLQTTVGSNCGIQIAGKHTNTTIANNEVNFSAINSFVGLTPGVLPPVPAGIFISTDGGLINGLIPSTAIININNNKINGFKQSVVFYDPAAGATPSIGYGYLTTGATVNISNNKFTGDSISIDNGTTSQAVTATCNWYNGSSTDVVEKKVKGSVLFTPWLTNETDNDNATGFQPVPGSCDGTPVVVTLHEAKNISCLGANNGSITTIISGGTAPYSSAWTKDGDPFSTTTEVNNLEPGTYSVTVTDKNGSFASLNEIVISEPLALTATAAGTNAICFNSATGSASVTAEGGTAPYTYQWSNGGAADEILNITAGSYTVTITDASGCIANANYIVTQPEILIATAVGTSTSCSNSITATAAGGKIPYTYAWTNGATTPTISSIAAGTYSVTVTDGNGCTVSATATVTASEAFNPSASVTNVNCYGGTDGSITVTNVNAVAPFQYSIDGGLHYQGNSTFSQLAAGTYTVTVKDANGCTGFITKTITQPVQLVASIASIQNTCFGQSAGSITVNTIGGTAGFTYLWTGTGGFTSTQKSIAGLAAGSYNFTVTDSKGCNASLTGVTLTSTNEIKADSLVTNISCKGELNGSISLNPKGGSGNGFTYLWNTGASTSSITNLGVSNYNVTITDIGTGCSIARTFTITQPASLVNLSAVKTNATGCASMGTITATASGGTPGYQYKLGNGNYQSSGTFTELSAGSYTVWAKDAGGCTKSLIVSLTDNGSDEYEGNNSKNQAKAINIGVNVRARIALTTDVADWYKFTPTTSGNYTLALSHPSSTFTFNLYAAGNNTPALTPSGSTSTSKQYFLTANTTYYVSITGGLSYQCYTLNVEATQIFTRSRQQQTSAEPIASELFEVNVLGNPSNSYFNIVVNSSSSEKIRVRVVDVLGRVIEQKENLTADQTIRIGEKYSRGAFIAEVSQGNNRKTIRLIKL